MKDLKCGLTACKHNKGYSCCAKSITVDRAADCSAYDPVASKRADFEAGADFVRANYSVDTEVSCSAKRLIASNDLSLTACSSRQASSAAVSSSTPNRTRKALSSVCRS